MPEITALTPWYRQFWPWVLIILPATTVIASLITIGLALKDPDGLVADDYYKEGLAINQVLARDQAAEARGISAYLDLTGLRLELTSQNPADQPELITLKLLHATRAKKDRILKIRQIKHGLYQAAPLSLEAGRWNIHLETEEWRVTGSLQVPGENRLRLTPVSNSH